jgi:hypothetical protein
MRLRWILLAPSCVVLGMGCRSGNPEVFSVEAEQRGFELPTRPILVFFVDGLRADVLEDVVRNGGMPRLSRLFFDRAAHVRSAVTSVPSVTYANAVTMLTGCWPSTHGVVANASFDREHLFMRDYEAEREYAADDDACTTIFELLADEVTAGIALPFERGVRISRAKSADSGGFRFGLSWITGREKTADELLSEQLYEIGEEVRDIGRWPALLVIHFPAVDDIGHEHGSDGAEYRDAVRNLDQVIGDVLVAFEQGGMLDDLTLVLTADHGHHSAPRSLELDECLEAALRIPVLLDVENDGEASFAARSKRYSDVRAVVTPSGKRMASVHLRTSENWSERPSVDEILRFPSLVGAAAPGTVPETLLENPAIDLVAVRAGEEGVRVYGRAGSAAIRSTRSGRGELSVTYEVLDGADPLGYDAQGLGDWMQSAHTSREWLAKTADLRYPDLVPQLVSIFAHPRSGDLELFAAPGWDFHPEEYVGGHGGVEREELIVPLYFAGPDIRAGVELSAARLVDLVPTLLELADVPVPDSIAFDGVSLAEELR